MIQLDEMLRRFANDCAQRKLTFYRKAYLEILENILGYFGVVRQCDASAPEPWIAAFFREHRIRRVLEIGCGDCQFLAALAPMADRAQVELVGIDLDPCPNASTKKILADRHVTILVGDATRFHGDENTSDWQKRDLFHTGNRSPDSAASHPAHSGFDLVIGCGVMSLWGAYPPSHRSRLHLGDLEWSPLERAISTAHRLTRNGLRLLSDHPKASLYVNTFGSLLLLKREEIEREGRVIRWDASRKGNARSLFRPKGNQQQEWEAFHDQAASFALLVGRADGAAQKPVRRFRGLNDRSCLAFSEDKALAVVRNYGMYSKMTSDRAFRYALWDHRNDEVTSFQFAPLSDEQANYIYDLALLPDRNRVISLSQDGTLRLWDPATRKELPWLREQPAIGTSRWPTPLMRSPQGNYVAAFGTDGLAIVDVRSGTSIHRTKNKDFYRIDPAGDFSPNETIFAFALTARSVAMIELPSGDVIATLSCGIDGKKIQALAFSPGRRMLLIGLEGGLLHLVSALSGRTIRLWSAGHRGPFSCLTFSPNGKRALSATCADADNRIQLWCLDRFREIARFEHTDPRNYVCKAGFLPDGEHMISGNFEGEILIWKSP